jgi:hypothetical protein
VSGTTLVTSWAARTADAHLAQLPQKDNLCGAFWGALVLMDAGVGQVDQDVVALESGTLLPEGDPVPPPLAGVPSRLDYRLSLPTAPEPQSGTPPEGLARSIAGLSGGRLAVVPVAGPWTAETVCDVVGDDPARALIANIDTSPLWGAAASDEDVRRHLQTGADDGPQGDWSVGHFVNPVSVERGPAGAIVTVRDTYPALGGGTHRQPASRFAAALRRTDGREGGILCVTAAVDAPALERRLRDRGMDIRYWDNGTPEPTLRG